MPYFSKQIFKTIPPVKITFFFYDIALCFKLNGALKAVSDISFISDKTMSSLSSKLSKRNNEKKIISFLLVNRTI